MIDSRFSGEPGARRNATPTYTPTKHRERGEKSPNNKSKLTQNFNKMLIRFLAKTWMRRLVPLSCLYVSMELEPGEI